MYLMKHLDEMEGLPKCFDKKIFSRILAIGELANLTPEEKMSYISSLEQKRVYNATIAYAEKEGMEKGKLEERAMIESIALGMKKDGLPIEQIAKYTKLTIEEIEKLK